MLFQCIGDTSFEFGALAHETGKLNHTQLLSKEDGGDGTCIKMQVYILSNDVHFVVRPHIHPKLEI